MPTSQKVTFTTKDGTELAAVIDLPLGDTNTFAVFAHCFTCSKDLIAAKTIANELANSGIGVLRFDFTGLGMSEGEFADTNFSSNVADLVEAVSFVEEKFGKVELLVGHSLGGAAVLSAASQCSNVKAVATLGAPSEASHVIHLVEDGIETIEATGKAEVSIGGRPFTIKKQFVDDLEATVVANNIETLGAALLVMHSPTDNIVGIDNAQEIFVAARHPKSFVSLDGADHLLLDRAKASYAATVIAAWASQYVTQGDLDSHDHLQGVTASETGLGKFQNVVHANKFHVIADEPASVGGLNSGMAPYDFLGASLATCTSMTLRMYSDHKKLNFGEISVTVSHDRIHAKDCEDCASGVSPNAKIDQFTRVIKIDDLPADLHNKVAEIADKCPVHKTLSAEASIVTNIE